MVKVTGVLYTRNRLPNKRLKPTANWRLGPLIVENQRTGAAA
jgi:hypothetical protein